MIDFLQNFHFLRPWLLLFLLLPLFLYVRKIKNGGNNSSWEDICDKNLLSFLLVNGSAAKKTSAKKFIYIGLIAGTLAAAGPAWQKTEIPTFTVENPNMFVLSLAQDMQLTDISPSRLERAKFMIMDITKSLPQGQFGLEVYSQEPYIITPITDDAELINNLMPQIVPSIVPDYGDRLDRAIDLALQRFSSAQYAQGNIILLTADVGQRFDLALEKVKAARTMNYTVNVIDCSFDGNEKLKILAETGGGVYLSVKNGNIQPLTSRISEITEERVKLSQNLRSNYLDYGYYLLFVALISMLAFFRRGLLVLLLCCFSVSAQAGFFTNENQDGLKLFQSGQYDQALDKFTDSKWRAITLYKQNKPDEALKELQKESDSDAFYNQGVILTQLCKYQEALAAFDKAISLNSENIDAKYNKKVLDELFEKAKEDPSVLNCGEDQQQNQNNNQNSDNNGDNNNDDNSQQNSEQNQEQEQNQDNNQNQENNQQNSDEQQNSEQENSDNNNQNEQEQNQDEQKSENGSQQNSDQNKNNEDTSDDKDSAGEDSDNNPNTDKNDQQSPANKDDGKENKSDNQQGENQAGDEEQQQEQEVNLANAKQGDKDEKYDEEALAMQRRYREIPEDVGGLLREFIKKEYLKGRYNDDH